MEILLAEILELYFLGGNIGEILGAVYEYVYEYRKHKQTNYIENIEKQMFLGWR